MAKRYVLLDRDGTIIVDKHYLADPAEVELLPGAAKGLRQIQRLGYGLILITNQSGVGRGKFTTETVDAVHEELVRQLKCEGINLDGIYYCPHVPEDDCNCRKPRTALAEQASKVFRFEPEKCIVVGDKASDIEMGQNLGAVSILVKTGKGEKEVNKCSADFVADNLQAAARMIGLVNLMDEMNDLEDRLFKENGVLAASSKEKSIEELLSCF